MEVCIHVHWGVCVDIPVGYNINPNLPFFSQSFLLPFYLWKFQVIFLNLGSPLRRHLGLNTKRKARGNEHLFYFIFFMSLVVLLPAGHMIWFSMGPACCVYLMKQVLLDLCITISNFSASKRLRLETNKNIKQAENGSIAVKLI